MEKLLRFNFSLLGLLLAVVAGLCMPAKTVAQDYYDFEENGLRFHILSEEAKTCEMVYNPDTFYPGDIVIPATVKGYTVTKLAQYTFYYAQGLTSVVIPNTVTEIARDCFVYTALTEINIPKSVTVMTSMSFGDNKQLVAYNVESGNPNYSSLDGVLYNAKKTALLSVPSKFKGDNGYYAIPSSVTGLANNAIYDNSELTEVFIPNTVTYWEASMFSGSKNIKKITLSSALTDIPAATFNGCTSLETIVIPDGYTKIGMGAFNGCESLKSMVIPNSVTVIDFNAFAKCKSLTSINLGTGLTELGDGVFTNCSALKSITLPASLNHIGSGAFSGCTGVEAITVAEGNQNYYINAGALFSTVGNEMLAYPLGLNETDIVIPDGTEAIGVDVFFEGKMKSLKFPNTLKSVNESFARCYNLTSVDFGSSIETIEYCSFYDCTSLTRVQLPASLKTLGKNAFGRRTNLTEIVMLGSVPPVMKESYDWDDNAYYNQFNDETFLNAAVYVPTDAVDTYKAAPGWSEFKNIQVTTGIKGVTLGENQVLWYTLDGKLLPTHPETPGLYIKRTASGTAKEVIR